MARVVSYHCDFCNKVKNGHTHEIWWIVRKSSGSVIIQQFSDKAYGEQDKLACSVGDAATLAQDFLDQIRREIGYPDAELRER